MTTNALSSPTLVALIRRLARAASGTDGIRAILAGTGGTRCGSGVVRALASGRRRWCGGPRVSPRFRIRRGKCPVETGDGMLGTVVVHAERPLTGEEQTLLEGVCDLLAVAVSRDVHQQELERQISERIRELADQRAFIECIVDSLPNGLYVVDRAYRIHAWNHKRETGLQGCRGPMPSGVRFSTCCTGSRPRCSSASSTRCSPPAVCSSSRWRATRTETRARSDLQDSDAHGRGRPSGDTRHHDW